MTEITHTHAWANEPHTHAMRAVCRRPECEGCPTHNIHPAPDEWSNHAHAHQTPPAPELVAIGSLVKGDRFFSPVDGTLLVVTWVHRGAPEGETSLEVRRDIRHLGVTVRVSGTMVPE